MEYFSKCEVYIDVFNATFVFVEIKQEKPNKNNNFQWPLIVMWARSDIFIELNIVIIESPLRKCKLNCLIANGSATKQRM